MAIFSYGVMKDLVRGAFFVAASRWGPLVIVSALLLQGWFVLGPEPTVLEGPRRTVAETALEKAAAQMPYDKSINRVAVLPFVRDPSLFITDGLRKRVADTGRYEVADKGAMNRMRQKLNLAPREVEGREAAVAAGRRAGVDAVIFGSVPEHVQDDASANIVMNVRMVGVGDNRTIADIVVRESLSKGFLSSDFVSGEVSQKPLLGRLLLWATACIMLPLLLAPLIRRVTVRESNALNLLLLAGFVFANLMLGLAIVGVELRTTVGALVLVVMILLAVAYNYAVCTRIDELSR